MYLGKVVGTVVATQKDENLTGAKLLIVQSIDFEQNLATPSVVAIDAVGAGEGEVVLVTVGSSARRTSSTKQMPVDAVIVAIVDTLEVNGKITYQKNA